MHQRNDRIEIPVDEALQHLCDRRRPNEVIISNMASARLWPRLSDHPLDFNYNPSAMGGVIPFGLGLALARPELHVIVLSGDGSLLMNLGSLVTAAANGPVNLTVVVLDNGMYEVTGGQRTPAGNRVNYADLARASGWSTAAKFETSGQWQSAIDTWLLSPGPRLAWLPVGPTPSDAWGHALPPIHQRIESFKRTIQSQRP